MGRVGITFPLLKTCSAISPRSESEWKSRKPAHISSFQGFSVVLKAKGFEILS